MNEYKVVDIVKGTYKEKAPRTQRAIHVLQGDVLQARGEHGLWTRIVSAKRRVPDVEYVTGQPFPDPRTLSRRVSSASEWDRPPQPDPRPAIARFRRDLEAGGVALIVMPTPVKPSVHPEGLAPRYAGISGVLDPSGTAQRTR